MPCTLSCQKRVRLAQASAPMSSVIWTSLPSDQVRSVGDCLLADNDVDDYMAFRAVCQSWRSATSSDDVDAAALLIPTKWALLDQRDDLITLVNINTGRFLCRRIQLLRRQFFFVGATSGGLILLGELAEPYRARVLNPFMGSIAHFKARVPWAGVMVVAMTTKPQLTVFISTKIGEIIWANQSMKRFKRIFIPYPYEPTCITCFGGNLYATDRYGTIYMSTVPANAVTAAVAGKPRRRSAVDIAMDAISPILDSAADKGHRTLMSGRFYLVESAGDLLLVTKPLGFTIDQPVVRRVNMETQTIEPVSSIGSRALFVSHVRCLSINADKFPSIQGGCVYFLPSKTGGYEVVDRTVVHVADNVVVEFGGDCGEGLFRPFTLAQVITDYCMSVYYNELHKKLMMHEWGWDVSSDDSDELSSCELDDEESSSSLHDDEASSSSEPADE